MVQLPQLVHYCIAHLTALEELKHFDGKEDHDDRPEVGVCLPVVHVQIPRDRRDKMTKVATQMPQNKIQFVSFFTRSPPQ